MRAFVPPAFFCLLLAGCGGLLSSESSGPNVTDSGTDSTPGGWDVVPIQDSQFDSGPGWHLDSGTDSDTGLLDVPPTPDTAPPIVPDWMTDPTLWRPVPKLDECEVYEAMLPSSAYPKHTLEACGDGCQSLVTDPLSAFFPADPVFHVTTGWSDGSSVFIRLVYGVPGAVVVREYLDVTHDTVLAAFSQRVVEMAADDSGTTTAQCLDDVRVIGSYGIESWRVRHTWASFEQLFARARYRETTELEPLGSITLDGDVARDVVPADGACAYLFEEGGPPHAELRWSDESLPLVFDAVTLAVPPSSSGGSVGTNLEAHGSRFVFPVTADESWIDAWSPTTGAVRLATRTAIVFDVAADDDGVSWVEWNGAATPITSSLVRLSDGGAPIVVASGLPGTGQVVSGGGLGAAFLCDSTIGGHSEVVVVRYSDGKTWHLGTGTDGRYWQLPSFIDAHTLVVGTARDVICESGYQDTQRLYVLDVGKLDSLVGTLGATAPP